MAKFPTQQQCLDLFEQYKVPLNIKEHCLAVQRHALILAKKLNDNGFNLDMEFVRTLSILHDLFKIAVIEDIIPNKFHDRRFTAEELEVREWLRSKYPYMHEAEIASHILKDVYPELASSLKDMRSLAESKTKEERFVHYIDWCTLRNEFVGLDNRLIYIRERYKGKEKYFEPDFINIKKFETEIFSRLNIVPEDLKQK